MIYNKFHEDSYILTQDGLQKISFLLQEGQPFKIYTLEQGFIPATLTYEPIDVSTRITTAVLDNGHTNITTSPTIYLTSHDIDVAASGILNKPLKTLHYYNNACNDYVYAGFIAAFCDYSVREQDYYIEPAKSPYFRDDLFCLLWSNAWDRCHDFIYLHDPYYREVVLKIFGAHVAAKAPMLPRDIDAFSEYDKTSFLRGMLSVYIEMSDSTRFSFRLPSETLMNQISNLLTDLGVENIAKVERRAPSFNPLTPGKLVDFTPTITIKPAFIDQFMNTIGVVTSCAIEHIEKVARKRATRAIEVQNIRYQGEAIDGKFYGIKPDNFNNTTSKYCVIGNVYCKIFE